jgi:hypothetical protein
MSKGDHIRVQRYGGFIYHHGIDMGDGTVVHFRKDNSGNKSIVDRTSMANFAKGDMVETVQYQSSDSPSVVVSRAADCHRLQREGSLKSYNLFELNCEHLATWCKTGKVRSEQIEDTSRIAQIAAQFVSEDVISLVIKNLLGK